MKVILAVAFCVLFAPASSVTVNLTSEWRPNFGWEVTCSWTLYSNDSLQSVKISSPDIDKADQLQYLNYRPERDGNARYTSILHSNIDLNLDCYENQLNGVTGKCVMSLEILQPVRNDLTYTCEVSGERPTFRVDSKTILIEALIPPSPAVVERIFENDQPSERENVNCSSSGMPAPTLVWTIGDQKIPQDFSGSSWNFTSKQYDVWSSLSYTPADSFSFAVCTPEILKGGKLLKGKPAHYLNAGSMERAPASSVTVNLTSEWRPNFGWEVTCSWTLYSNDSLQSVKISSPDIDKADQLQYLNYRPERDGNARYTSILHSNIDLNLDCYENQLNGVTGKCVMSLEILQPVRNDLTYTCEVSGERPTFRVDSKTILIEALIPPSPAVVERIFENDQPSERENVNCSSSGMPAPTLVWTIGDQKIPQDFSGSSWNFTSKQYDVWSSLSYTPADSFSFAVCTPEILKGGKLLKGKPAHYLNAGSMERGTAAIILFVSLVLNLMR